MNQMWQLSYALADFFHEVEIAQDALKIMTQATKIIDTPYAKPLTIRKGEIEFKNSNFNYNPDKLLFQHFNILIESNQKVGIVDHSGSGKHENLLKAGRQYANRCKSKWMVFSSTNDTPWNKNARN